MKINLDKVLKISIIIEGLLISLSVVYYLMIFLPRNENVRMEQLIIKEKNQKECADYAKQQACNGTGLCEEIKYNFRLKKCLNEKGL